jgi:hypothetical protein
MTTPKETCPKCKSGVKFIGAGLVEYFCYSQSKPDGSSFLQSSLCKDRRITELEKENERLRKGLTEWVEYWQRVYPEAKGPIFMRSVALLAEGGKRNE